MPYLSSSQRRFFHTLTAKRKGVSADTVKEFDDASKGMKLTEKVKPRRKVKFPMPDKMKKK